MKRLPQNQLAYEQLKAAIITLRLQPGSYLNETAICAELRLSRSPVHHALHRLMHEGLVSVVPRKGVLVKPLSMNDFLELMAVRRINEPTGAALAAERITQAELEHLNANLAIMREAKRDNLINLIMLDRNFHALIATASRNRALAQIIKSVHDRSSRFWALALSLGVHLDDILQEHISILHYLQQRDAQNVSAAMVAHIDSFSRALSTIGEIS